MSVLIKGMEKPEHCGYCRFRYDGICHALQKTQYNMNECPLVIIDDTVDVVRCKDCKHRPERPEGAVYYEDLIFPDGVCPCQCDDYFYSWIPDDDWFCADGERKDD